MSPRLQLLNGSGSEKFGPLINATRRQSHSRRQESEQKLQPKLNLPGRSEISRGNARIGNDPEARSAHDTPGISEVRVIEDVEGFGAELQDMVSLSLVVLMMEKSALMKFGPVTASRERSPKRVTV
jgi:hypothetical protein